MYFFRKLLLSVLFTLSAMSFGYAQGTLSGKVLDSTGKKPVEKATVSLVEKANPKDTIRTSSNTKGEFVFGKIPGSGYKIIISVIGYKPYSKDFFSPSPGVTQIDLGDFVLLEAYKEMGEIVIEAPAIQMKEDTVEYRASAFAVKPNASTEDLLKKMPGLQVDRDGNITAQGKQVTRIKVNGKDFFTGDPRTASKEIPAEMIDKVQVVDDYGDQSAISGVRDGEPEKVINLQLKKDKTEGYIARGTAGYGTVERYQANGTVQLFSNKQQLSIIGNSNNINTSTFSGQDGGGFGGGGFGGGGGAVQISMNGGGGGNRGGMGISSGMGNLFGGGGGGQNQNGITVNNSIGLNYRNDFGARNSFYGSYTYTHRSTDLQQLTSQQSLFNTATFTNNTTQQSLNKQGTHRAFANLEWYIDSFNYIKISPNVSIQETNNQLINNFDFFRTATVKSQAGSNRDTTVGERPNIRTNVLYNLRFKKRGRNFSLNTDLSYNENVSEQMRANNTQFFLSNGAPGFLLNQLQRINQDNQGYNINARAVYTEPIAKDRFIDFSYNFNHNYSKNDRQTFQKDLNTGLFNFIGPLSNAFENNFDFNRFGTSLRTVKKKYNYTLGVLMQPVSLKGYSITKDSAYQPIKNFNWFPVARFTYNFTRTKTFTFNYNGSAQQPSFNQLQPVRDITNPQFQSEGNPRLQPSVNHNLNFNFNNFNFSTGRVFLMNLSLLKTNNQIVNNNISLKDANGLPTGAQLTRPENVDGFYNVNAFYTYSRPWQNRKYVLSVLGTVNYNNNINLVDSIRNIGKNWLVSQGLNFDLNLKEWLELSLGGRYNLNAASFSLPGFQSQRQQTWTLSSDARIDIPGGWIMRWDFDYFLNRGLAQGIGRNIALLNASMEKEIFKKKNGVIRVNAFDILKQNVSINRSVNGNFITDTRVNRLTQYFMLSFTYRLSKFKGAAPQQNNMRMQRGGMMNF